MEEARASGGSRAREFAREFVGPMGEVLDRDGPRRVGRSGLAGVATSWPRRTARDSPGSATSRERGGLPVSRGVTEYFVLEELATADAGLAAVLIAVAAPVPLGAGGGRRAPDRRAMSRPYFSRERTDWSGCCAAGGPASRLRATRAGDGWLLAGEHLALGHRRGHRHARAAGLRGGRWRALHARAGGRPARASGRDPRRAARPPRPADPVADPAGARRRASQLRRAAPLTAPPAQPVGAARAMAHVATAIVAVGIGRAAYEGTLRLAREQMRDGRPLVEHPETRRRLLRMFTLLDAARSLTRAVHLYTAGRLDAREGCSIQHAAAAHAFATEGAFEIVDAAMDLCGPRARGRRRGAVPGRLDLPPREAAARCADLQGRTARGGKARAPGRGIPLTQGGRHGIREDPGGDRPHRARSQPPTLRQRRDAVASTSSRDPDYVAYDPAAAARAGRHAHAHRDDRPLAVQLRRRLLRRRDLRRRRATTASRAATCSRCTWTTTCPRSTAATCSASPRSWPAASCTAAATSFNAWLERNGVGSWSCAATCPRTSARARARA